MALRQAAAQAATLLRLSSRPAVSVSLCRRGVSTTHIASGDQVREGLLYAESHEWVKVDGEIGTVGITDHAQSALGDLVFAELPTVGTVLEVSDVMGSVESVKAASELYSPVSGEVVEVNESPYEDGWFMKVKLSKPPQEGKLMDDVKYSKFQNAEESH